MHFTLIYKDSKSLEISDIHASSDNSWIFGESQFFKESRIFGDSWNSNYDPLTHNNVSDSVSPITSTLVRLFFQIECFIFSFTSPLTIAFKMRGGKFSRECLCWKFTPDKQTTYTPRVAHDQKQTLVEFFNIYCSTSSNWNGSESTYK